ncbi:MAG: heme o synthase, partial [Chloroflexota bacterium]
MAIGEATGREAAAGEPLVTHSRAVQLSAYWALTKPRIMSLLLFTTFAALLIAVRQHPLPSALFVRVLAGTMLGGALASGGAAALN